MPHHSKILGGGLNFLLYPYPPSLRPSVTCLHLTLSLQVSAAVRKPISSVGNCDRQDDPRFFRVCRQWLVVDISDARRQTDFSARLEPPCWLSVRL